MNDFELGVKSPLITALVPVEIPECDLSLPAGSSAFLTHYQYVNTSKVRDLEKIRAIKVEWVIRHPSRRVPEMKEHPNRRYLPSNIYRPNIGPTEEELLANAPPVLSDPAPVANPAPVVNRTPVPEVRVTRVPEVTALTEKLDHIDRELSELKSLIPSLQSIRDLLAQTVSNSTARPVAESEEIPVFIPSKIVEDSTVVEIKSETSDSTVTESADALRSVRKRKG